MNVDFSIVNRTDIPNDTAKMQSFVIALLNIVPYGESIDKVTLTKHDHGYVISVKTDEQRRTIAPRPIPRS